MDMLFSFLGPRFSFVPSHGDGVALLTFDDFLPVVVQTFP